MSSWCYCRKIADNACKSWAFGTFATTGILVFAAVFMLADVAYRIARSLPGGEK
jgi:hypothetical protein